MIMRKYRFWINLSFVTLAILFVTSGCILNSKGTLKSYDQPGLKGVYVLDPEDTTTNVIWIGYGGDGEFYSGMGYGLGVTDIPWGFSGGVVPLGEYHIRIGLHMISVGTDGARLGDDIVRGTILYTPPEEGGVVEEIHFREQRDDAETYVLVRWEADDD